MSRSAPPPGASAGAPEGLDFDDGDMGSTAVGTDLFKAQAVPAYPTLARLGRYEILGRLARGGMAEVYLARAREDDGSVSHVVVKRVLAEVENDPKMRAMFVDEGRLAVRLFHPNICHVYEVGEADGMTFMALEWVHGATLREIIRRAAPKGLPIPVSVHVMARVAAALEYVHTARGLDGKRLRLVHQDVSPHNVMVRWTGEVKLLDFGVARKVGTGQEKGAAAQGKVEYMSPEQVRGQALDGRSDVFALGICLYEVLTSQPLYARGGAAASMMAIAREAPPSLGAARAGVPPGLDAIVQKALAKDPAKRWQSAGELETALEGWLKLNGHIVADPRVAVSVSTLFSAEEKTPLPPEASRSLSGTLPALGEDEAISVLVEDEAAQKDSWSETFEHGSERPPPLAPTPPTIPTLAPSAPARGAGRGLWLGLALAAGLAIGGVAAWLWLAHPW